MTSKEIWRKKLEKEIAPRSLDDLIWHTPEGIAIEPLYTDETRPSENYPGLPPFTRGVYASMYAGKPWTIRQYAGFSTPEESNAFYKMCLASGQKGLSVAFDLATHRGYDSDNPRVEGDVGKAGVAIDSVEDMKELFEGIPLDRVSVSMTMNGAVLPILAFYIIAAEEQGIAIDQLSGTVQNDILKEFMVRNTYIYPPEPSMRIVGDIIGYCSRFMPRFNPISISGYHMHEAGATAVQELGYTLANGLEYVRCALAQGLSIDAFAPRLSFFFGIGMNFFMEVAKLRAARRLWCELMEPFEPKNPASSLLRTHCQTSGVSLTVQDPHNNIVRTTVEALAAILGGTQSLHTNGMDEAVSLPTPLSARIARQTQLILAEEAGLTHVVDPLGGSHYIESLTHQLLEAARSLINEVEAMGGMTKAVSQGIPKRHIEESATRRQMRIDSGEDPIIGVNYFAREEADHQVPLEILDINTQAVRQRQVDRLTILRHQRDQERCAAALAALTAVANGHINGNLLEATLEAARARATLGEISLALEEVYGRYEAPHQVMTGLYQQTLSHNEEWISIHQRIEQFEKDFGRRPRILLGKLGQDGHDRGVKIIASALVDCGFDVDLGPLFMTPKEVARHAVENDVHLIGISSLTAGHKVLIPQLIEALKDYEAQDIRVICGGILPVQDHAFLKEAGVAAIFVPGMPVLNIIKEILAVIMPHEEICETI